MAKDAEAVLALARQQLGYLEKRTNAMLDSKTANAGSGNYTKFARDLDAVPGFYNGRKNGYPWCDVFVDWLFVKLFGAETARKMLFQPEKSYGAGCAYSARYYMAAGRFYRQDPQPGDQIFFRNFAHTGLVTAVDEAYVYTVEGNTSARAGVVANGGGVWEKQYPRGDSCIDGYGRPGYDPEPETQAPGDAPAGDGVPAGDAPAGTGSAQAGKGEYHLKMRILKQGCKGEDVRALQILLTGRGHSCGTSGADGDFGSQTAGAVAAFQARHKLTRDAIAGPATMAALLGGSL